MNISPENNTSETILRLSSTVERIQDEMVDVINKLEKLTCLFTQNSISSTQVSPKKPKGPEKSRESGLYRNPTDIPNYDSIQEVEAEVHNPADNSIVSIDEFVEEVGAQQNHSLN